MIARRIGTEQQPIAIVDGFHPDPDALRGHAASLSFTAGRNHYPGIRAPLPDDYFRQVRVPLMAVLREVFGAARIDLLDASYAIVTTPPAQLESTQRLPHVDATEAGRIALVHYLSPEGGDGTAFFRHRTTGFERVDAGRAPDYYARLNAELVEHGPPPPAYIDRSTPLFERVATVEARYNRAVIYRSALLHSGAIAAGAPLSPDPATGRLTVTAFLATA